MANSGLYWNIIRRTMKRFREIDGEQRAPAFSYYAVFSMFPLILLFVTIGSYFVKRDAVVDEIVRFVSQYVPLAQEGQNLVFKTIDGVLSARGEVGIVALLVLVWGALKFLKVLIRSTNRARGSRTYNWWQLPLKTLSAQWRKFGDVLFVVSFRRGETPHKLAAEDVRATAETVRRASIRRVTFAAEH